MAALLFFQARQRRLLQRNRIFRDRTNPFDTYDDREVFRKFRFRRQHILELTRQVSAAITLANRGFTLTPLQQVLVTLRFLATSTFQDVCGELVGVDQSTVSRTVSRVTDAMFRQAWQHIFFPDQTSANRTKRALYQSYGFPNAVGCIDGTQVRVQRPHEQEHEFVNRKGYHSINVQVGLCTTEHGS